MLPRILAVVATLGALVLLVSRPADSIRGRWLLGLVFAAAVSLRAVGFDPARLRVLGTGSLVVPQVLTTRLGGVQAATARISPSSLFTRTPFRTPLSHDREDFFPGVNYARYTRT